MGARIRLCASAQHRKPLAILVAGLLPLVARALLLPILPRTAAGDSRRIQLSAGEPIRSPHGRLANPTPALAEHFETLQELMRPVLRVQVSAALGAGDGSRTEAHRSAVDGVWLSMGVLCAVLCWALQGWLPAVWALAGSLIAVLHIGIVSYWTESYWGGALAAIGGALLIGAHSSLDGAAAGFDSGGFWGWIGDPCKHAAVRRAGLRRRLFWIFVL